MKPDVRKKKRKSEEQKRNPGKILGKSKKNPLQ